MNKTKLKKAIISLKHDVLLPNGKIRCSGSLKWFKKRVAQSGVKKSEIPAYVDYVQKFGGYDDCEVIMNVLPVINRRNSYKMKKSK